MIERLVGAVELEITLAHIGDVARFRILREEVVEGLILARPHLGGDRLIPLVTVGEHRIDIEDHTAKGEQPMANDIADGETRVQDRRHARGGGGDGGRRG